MPPEPSDPHSTLLPFHIRDDIWIKRAGKDDCDELAKCFLDGAGEGSPFLEFLSKRDTSKGKRTPNELLKEHLCRRFEDTRFVILKIAAKNSTTILGMLVYGYRQGHREPREEDKDDWGYQFVRKATGSKMTCPEHWVHENSAVRKGEQKRGLGKELLGLALRQMMEDCPAPTYASPRDEAIGFFKRFGFESVDETPNFMVRKAIEEVAFAEK